MKVDPAKLVWKLKYSNARLIANRTDLGWDKPKTKAKGKLDEFIESLISSGFVPGRQTHQPGRILAMLKRKREPWNHPAYYNCRCVLVPINGDDDLAEFLK